MKYYNFGNRASGKKVNMTPKLYDQVATRLLDTWGTYAGWAHSVNQWLTTSSLSG